MSAAVVGKVIWRGADRGEETSQAEEAYFSSLQSLVVLVVFLLFFFFIPLPSPAAIPAEMETVQDCCYQDLMTRVISVEETVSLRGAQPISPGPHHFHHPGEPRP